jgi:DNA-binding response OmpR family regulator
VILFDTEMRKPGPEEIEAFSLVTLLLAWGEEPAHEAEQAFPATREPITHLDEPTRRLVGPGGAVRLTVSEWDLLSIFFANKGNAVSFQQMTREVWRAPEEHVSRTVIYEVIGRLRRHLTSVGDEYRIASVPRFGYMLEPSSSEPG